jgi:hypothetical protein
MPKYTIELFQMDDTLLARSSDREVPSLTRDEMLAWARDAAEKFGMVWEIGHSACAPTLGYARVVCDGLEVLRVSVPSELGVQ